MSISNNIISIRPKVLFQKIEDTFPNQNISMKVNIPSPAIGGMTLLECSVHVCLCKLLKPKKLFEFGTYLGATTLLLAENTDNDAEIVSVDLEPDQVMDSLSDINQNNLDILKNDLDNDNFLRLNFAEKGPICIKNSSEDILKKVTQIYQDSTLIDVDKQGYKNKFDYIFIDGGHDLETIRSDTSKSLQMIKDNGVILWHDFNSKIHGDVTKFLNEYSQDNTIYHVENTMIAFQLFGDYGKNF